MKKIITSVVALSLVMTATWAQTSSARNAETTLKKNLTTIDELQKLLMEEYNQLSDASSAVSAKNFKMGACMALTSFGDAAAQKQAKTMEDEFNKIFGGSIWSFDAYNQFNQVQVAVKAGDKTEKTPYSAFPGSATFRISSLIQGMEIEAYIYQNKEDKNSHMIFFPVSNGMVIAAVFTITNEKATASTNTKPAAEATEVAVPGEAKKTAAPASTGLKNKAKIAVKGNPGKLF